MHFQPSIVYLRKKEREGYQLHNEKLEGRNKEGVGRRWFRSGVGPLLGDGCQTEAFRALYFPQKKHTSFTKTLLQVSFRHVDLTLWGHY